MTSPLSANTQAILLLTAPLLVARGSGGESPLLPTEYRALALHLRQLKRQPADLLGADAESVLRSCGGVSDPARLRRLLARGLQLSQALEHWAARAIWIVSRADVTYPRRWKQRLKEDAPAVLYGCGNEALLERGGLAVVGSRHVDAPLIEYSDSIGRLAAEAGQTIVSGGARGIDQAAMRGALAERGNAIGVLGDGLQRAAMSHDYRAALLEGRLLLLSPYDPGASFNVGHAMQRNKLVYALSDAALVVSSDVNKGGTWAGAIEQLERLRFVPVYVRPASEPNNGLEALQKRGARLWPEPASPAELVRLLGSLPRDHSSTVQNELPLAVHEPENP